MANDTLNALYETILSRKEEKREGSYTCYLFEQGIDKILKKVGEECTETIIAAKNQDNEALTGELADLLYHLAVMMVERNLPMEALLAELEQRTKKTGNLKKFKTVDKNS